MTTPENKLGQNNPDISENNHPAGEFEGIADEALKSFMITAADKFHYNIDGSIDERATLGAVIPHLYSPSNPETYTLRANQVSDIRSKWGNLSAIGLVEYVRLKSNKRLIDRDSMINGLTYLFVEKRIREQIRKKRAGIGIGQILKLSTDLWGENPRAQIFKDADAKLDSGEGLAEPSRFKEKVRTLYYWGNEKYKPLSKKLSSIGLDEVNEMLDRANYEDYKDTRFKGKLVNTHDYKIDHAVLNILEFIRLANIQRLDLLDQNGEIDNNDFMLGIKTVRGYLKSENKDPKIINLLELYKAVCLVVNKNPSLYGLRK